VSGTSARVKVFATSMAPWVWEIAWLNFPDVLQILDSQQARKYGAEDSSAPACSGV